MNVTIKLRMYEERIYRKDSDAELSNINTLIIQINIVTLITLSVCILNVGLTCAHLLNGGFRRSDHPGDSDKGRKRKRRRHGQSHRQSNRQSNRLNRRRGEQRPQFTAIQSRLQSSINTNAHIDSFSDDTSSEHDYVNL